MAKTRIKAGDTVLVVSGKDKGTKAKVLKVLHDRDRVIVEGVARVTKHEKSDYRGQGGSKRGGIVHKSAPIHISNVMLVDSDGKATRVGSRPEPGTKTRTDGSTVKVTRRVRVSKRTGKDIS